MDLYEILNKRAGLYSIHYLINLYNEDKDIDIKLINNNKDITYGNKIYRASAFRYKFNNDEYGFNGGGSLEISAKEENVINLIHEDCLYLDVIKIIIKDNEIEETLRLSHRYGTISGNREIITFTFEKDDRLSMTFPTLIWSAQNNKGNS